MTYVVFWVCAILFLLWLLLTLFQRQCVSVLPNPFRVTSVVSTDLCGLPGPSTGLLATKAPPLYNPPSIRMWLFHLSMGRPHQPDSVCKFAVYNNLWYCCRHCSYTWIPSLWLSLVGATGLWAQTRLLCHLFTLLLKKKQAGLSPDIQVQTLRY